MARDLITLLNHEIKRRPELAEQAAQVDIMSEADIQQLKVPLPWMRKALLLLKQNNRTAELQRFVEQHVIDSTIPDPIGTLRRWTGPETYIDLGRTRTLQSQLLIKPDQLIWVSPQGIWFDSVVTHHVDPRLLEYSVVCGSISRSDYYARVREGSNQVPVPAEPSGQFQIYRPA